MPPSRNVWRIPPAISKFPIHRRFDHKNRGQHAEQYGDLNVSGRLFASLWFWEDVLFAGDDFVLFNDPAGILFEASSGIFPVIGIIFLHIILRAIHVPEYSIPAFNPSESHGSSMVFAEMSS